MEKEFYVHGMHCAACEFLVEDKLSQVDGITDVKANLATCKVKITTNKDIGIKELSKAVEGHGYKILSDKESISETNKKELIAGLLISAAIFSIFLILQKLGIVNLINPKQVTLPFVFLIGVVASLSTCMAVVGGLVLSLSSTFSQNRNYTPLIAFHIARIVGFFILGGLIGLLGSALILNGTGYLILNTILFLVMLIMGLNLLNLNGFTKALQLRTPKSFAKFVTKLGKRGGILYSALLGAATFILPCGFTQSMQIYSLTTGSFIQGALTMLVFALGTFPVLSLISFMSFKVRSELFFKTAGFLVLLFAFFNFLSVLNTLII